MTAKEFFDTLPGEVEPEKIANINQSYLFVVPGEGSWLVEIADGKLQVTDDAGDEEADVTISAPPDVFEGLVAGTISPMKAYMTGKLKVSGDIGAALKLQKLF